MTEAMWASLPDLCHEASHDSSVLCVILTGEGGHFCAGADIGEFDRVFADAASAAAYNRTVQRGPRRAAAPRPSRSRGRRGQLRRRRRQSRPCRQTSCSPPLARHLQRRPPGWGWSTEKPIRVGSSSGSGRLLRRTCFIPAAACRPPRRGSADDRQVGRGRRSVCGGGNLCPGARCAKPGLRSGRRSV